MTNLTNERRTDTMPDNIKSVVSPRLLNRLTAFGGEEMMPLVEDILKEAWQAGYKAGLDHA